MRCLLPILAYVILHVNVGNAQLLKSVGAKVAYTSADQVFDYAYFDIGRTRRNGINAGIFAEWFDGEPVSLVAQVEYAQRGMGMKFIVTTPENPQGLPPADYFGRVDYLSFPILAKLRILDLSVKPYLLGGFRFDFLLKHVSEMSVFDLVYDKFSKFTYGMSFGAGVEFDDLPIIIEARYNFDLNSSYRTAFLNVSNNSIDIWLGIAFST